MQWIMWNMFFCTLWLVTGLSTGVASYFFIRIIICQLLLSTSELIFDQIYPILDISRIIIHRNCKTLLQRYPKQWQRSFEYNFICSIITRWRFRIIQLPYFLLTIKQTTSSCIMMLSTTG